MSILQDLLALNVPVTQALAIDEAEELSGYEARQAAEELVDIHKEISELMSHARQIVRRLPRHVKGSAESYWIPHIMIALGGEHEWMTAGHESTMQKTIDDLEEYARDDEGEGADHDRREPD